MADTANQAEEPPTVQVQPIRRHKSHRQERPALTRQDGTPLQVNDILVAKIQYAGCSYHHVFVRILRITAAGGLRVRIMPCKSQEIDCGTWGNTTQVWPDVTPSTPDVKLESFLLRPDGSKGSARHNYEQYQHYTDDMKVTNLFDNGD